VIEQSMAEVQNLVRTRIPTAQGEFMLYYYSNNVDGKEHIALVKGNVEEQHGVLVRLHSECFTGDVLGSRRCDCGEQLSQGLNLIGHESCGVLIYLRQEGRGIGLLKKLKAYNLQDQGFDTVDANIELGHLPDERDYRVAAFILGDLAVRSVQLITNNPNKITALSACGIEVDKRIPLEIQYNDDNFDYLKTKANKMNHLLSLNVEEERFVLPFEFHFLKPLMTRMKAHHGKTQERPFVTLSYAQSIDGSIAVHNGDSCALSCSESMKMTHWLRTRHDALLVGVNTILVDNPQLNVRYCEGENPQPVVLDSVLRIPLDARILQEMEKAPVIITTEKASVEKRRCLIELGARVYTVGVDDSGRVKLRDALSLLNELGFKTVMVEGGAAIIDEFLSAQQVNYCVITLVPQLIGGLKAVGNPCRPDHKPPVSIFNCKYHTLGSDLIALGALKTD